MSYPLTLDSTTGIQRFIVPPDTIPQSILPSVALGSGDVTLNYIQPIDSGRFIAYFGGSASGSPQMVALIPGSNITFNTTQNSITINSTGGGSNFSIPIPIPLASGGTNNGSSYPNNSVIFYEPSGSLSGNSDLTWNNLNKNLSINGNVTLTGVIQNSLTVFQSGDASPAKISLIQDDYDTGDGIRNQISFYNRDSSQILTEKAAIRVRSDFDYPTFSINVGNLSTSSPLVLSKSPFSPNYLGNEDHPIAIFGSGIVIRDEGGINSSVSIYAGDITYLSGIYITPLGFKTDFNGGDGHVIKQYAAGGYYTSGKIDSKDVTSGAITLSLIQPIDSGKFIGYLGGASSGNPGMIQIIPGTNISLASTPTSLTISSLGSSNFSLPIPVPVASGGTNNSTTWNTGSIVFYDSGAPSLSGNPYLYWNNTARELNLGAGATTANLIVDGQIFASGQIKAGAPQGTSPFIISSTTLVPNLNVSYLGGIPSSGYVERNNAYIEDDLTVKSQYGAGPVTLNYRVLGPNIGANPQVVQNFDFPNSSDVLATRAQISVDSTGSAAIMRFYSTNLTSPQLLLTSASASDNIFGTGNHGTQVRGSGIVIRDFGENVGSITIVAGDNSNISGIYITPLGFKSDFTGGSTKPILKQYTSGGYITSGKIDSSDVTTGAIILPLVQPIDSGYFVGYQGGSSSGSPGMINILPGTNITFNRTPTSLTINGNAGGGSNIDGSGTSIGVGISVLQTGHSLTNGMPIWYHSGSGLWMRARSDAAFSIGTHITSRVESANNFFAMQCGVVSGVPNLNTTGWYYVSNETAGSLTQTEPTSGYSNPIGFCPTPSSLYMFSYRASQIIGGASVTTIQNGGTNNSSFPTKTVVFHDPGAPSLSGNQYFNFDNTNLTLNLGSPSSSGDIRLIGHILSSGQSTFGAPQGFSPFTVVSTTMVPNLNSNYLGGIASSGYVERNNAEVADTLSVISNNSNRQKLYLIQKGQDLGNGARTNEIYTQFQDSTGSIKDGITITNTKQNDRPVINFYLEGITGISALQLSRASTQHNIFGTADHPSRINASGLVVLNSGRGSTAIYLLSGVEASVSGLIIDDYGIKNTFVGGTGHILTQEAGDRIKSHKLDTDNVTTGAITLPLVQPIDSGYFVGYQGGLASGSPRMIGINPGTNVTFNRTETGLQINTSLYTAASGLRLDANNNFMLDGLGRKNAIINGSCDVWQRIGTVSIDPFCAGSGIGYVGCDKWGYTTPTASTSGCRSTDVPTFAQAGRVINYSNRYVTWIPYTSPGASDYACVYTTIEGYLWKNFAQQTNTLSFWVRSPKTGTHSVALTNSDSGKTFVGDYSVAAANTWEFKTIYIDPSPSAGTWDYTNGVGLRIFWALYCGTTFRGSPGWNSAQNLGSTNQTLNVVDTHNNIFAITGVQFERGSGVTQFEARSYQQELADCQRYLWTTYGHVPVGNGQNYSTSAARILILNPVTMRANPSLTVSNITHFSLGTATLGVNPLTGFAIQEVTPNLIWLNATVAGTPQVAGDVAYLTSNTTQMLMYLSAEI